VGMHTALLAPDTAKKMHDLLVTPPAIGEVRMVGYLLVKGVVIPRPEEPGQSTSASTGT
jgi:hypothetical protein